MLSRNAKHFCQGRTCYGGWLGVGRSLLAAYTQLVGETTVAQFLAFGADNIYTRRLIRFCLSLPLFSFGCLFGFSFLVTNSYLIWAFDLRPLDDSLSVAFDVHPSLLDFPLSFPGWLDSLQLTRMSFCIAFVRFCTGLSGGWKSSSETAAGDEAEYISLIESVTGLLLTVMWTYRSSSFSFCRLFSCFFSSYKDGRASERDVVGAKMSVMLPYPFRGQSCDLADQDQWFFMCGDRLCLCSIRWGILMILEVQWAGGLCRLAKNKCR